MEISLTVVVTFVEFKVQHFAKHLVRFELKIACDFNALVEIFHI